MLDEIFNCLTHGKPFFNLQIDIAIDNNWISDHTMRAINVINQ
ncbi:MAG: hypothetical protein ABIE07_07340 [Candidatus Zixiibacteriota bacterium]